MTDCNAVPAAVRITPQDARGRPRYPARNRLIAILRLAVPALAFAVAMLLGAGAQVRAFPGLDRPSVSIAAEHGSYGFGIDDVIFKLRRAGPADDAVSVRVSLAQAHPYLPTDRLNAVVRFRAGKRDAALHIPARQFNGPATQSGVLSATLVAAFGYTLGHPDSARTRMVVKNPAITVRPEQASYTVEPEDGAVRVTFMARTEGELPRPGKAFSLAVSSKAASDETAARRIARGVSKMVEFKPRNFVSTGGKWEASTTVSFSTAEAAEGLEVMFKRAASTPERIRPRNADGTPCANDVCMVPIIMTQSEEPTLTIAAGQESYGSDGAARLSDGLEDDSDPAWRRDAGLTNMDSRGVAMGDLLTGTSFAVTAENGQGGYVSLWGRGAVTRFDGREGKLTLDGEVSSAMLGADWAREDWTAGLIAARSDAEGGYEGHSGGRVAATLTGLYPWGRLALSERVDAWGPPATAPAS